MRDLPTGTVTFLFTDVEGSTRLLHELGAEAYAEALAEHRRVIREACAAEGGVEVDTQGDAFFFAFPTAPGALAAAGAMTDALASGPIQVRVGLHTGTPLLTEEGYVGDDLHRAARIAAAGHGGQVLVSVSTAQLVGSELVDLGEHRFKDLAAPERMYQLGDAEFPAIKSQYRMNLPVPATPFLGREHELAEVAELLATTRLLTLTGPGGTGKTRLGLQAAAIASDDYPEGIYWVPLAAVRDPALVIPSVTQALEAKVELPAHIADKRLLLLLDNFEQVVEAAAELPTLLEQCPNLCLLVTSRALLDVRGEVAYAVSPMRTDDAIELFCQRSRLAPDREIAELCMRLDSLPLAVELAAARTRAFSPRQILDRLGQRLDLLKGGRDADPRQRTLRATIEWSYELLTSSEQQLFARLSVFADGCTLESAEEVADANLDTLQSLVERNLLRFTAERYWMLETIREYAAECLKASADEDAVRARHRARYVALARSLVTPLFSGREGAANDILALEYGNIREAVARAFASGEPDDAATVVGAIWPFLITRGHVQEGREWSETALAASGLSPQGRAEALVGAGQLARFGGDHEGAVRFKEELLALDADPQRPNWRAATLADLAEIALGQGDLERARVYAEDCVAAGGGARAELVNAELSLQSGDLVAAIRFGRASLSGFEEGEFNYACALEIVGEAARRSGDRAGARAWFEEALRRFADLGDAGGTADALEGLARLANEASDPERAGRLLGAAEALRRESGRQATRSDVPLPPVLESARAAGSELSVEAAVSYALDSGVSR